MYRKVIDILEKYRQKRNDPMADYYIGRSYLETGMPEHALKEFLPLVQEWPFSEQLMFQTGRACAAAGRRGEAHYYFYKYYSMINNNEIAAYHRRKALRLLPEHSPLRRKIGSGEETKDHPGAKRG
jgi:tetratricopeptide (TPR) repeat protein